MAHEREYPYEFTTFVQTNEGQPAAQSRVTYLIGLFFIILSALAVIAMVRFPPTWDLIQ